MESYASIQEQLRRGFELYGSGRSAEACDRYLHAWADVLERMQADGIRDLNGLQAACVWFDFVTNWVQDIEEHLRQTCRSDPSFHVKRIRYCEQVIPLAGLGNDLMIENFRRSIAESTLELGDADGFDRMYRTWLEHDPDWGWGYIGWSDGYHFGSGRTPPDPARAAEILDRAAAVPTLRDRIDVLDRMADLHLRIGDGKRAAELEEEIRRLNAPEMPPPAPDLPKPTRVPKSAASSVGRNDPCPCGSGKKYKKCCGR